MKFVAPLLGIIFFSVQTKPSLADTYQWVDTAGTVHFTDNPEELPEPYRSKALNELIEKRKHDRQTPQPTDGSGALPDVSSEKLPVAPKEIPPITAPDSSDAPYYSASPAGDPAAKKKLWKEKANQAQKQVTDLTSLCDALRLQLAEAVNTKAIFSRPGDIARAEKTDEDLKRCEHDLERARRYLEEGLPDEARRNGIPPGWLR